MNSTLSERFRGFCHTYGFNPECIDPVRFGSIIFGPYFAEYGYDAYKTSKGEPLILPGNKRKFEIFVSRMKTAGLSAFHYNHVFYEYEDRGETDVLENDFVKLFLECIRNP